MGAGIIRDVEIGGVNVRDEGAGGGGRGLILRGSTDERARAVI